ncbi:MAG: hypothetical protein ACJARM_002859, partial [Glaciecola sp.]
ARSSLFPAHKYTLPINITRRTLRNNHNLRCVFNVVLEEPEIVTFPILLALQVGAFLIL